MSSTELIEVTTQAPKRRRRTTRSSANSIQVCPTLCVAGTGARRHYGFTLNFPDSFVLPEGLQSSEDLLNLPDIADYVPRFGDPLLRYLQFQLERAPTTGKLHLQGYVQLTTPQRFSALHKLPGFAHASFMTLNGSAEDNILYCSKVDSQVLKPVFFGTSTDQGKSAELVRVVDELAEVKPENWDQFVADNAFTFVHHYRGLEYVYGSILATRRGRSRRELELVYIWGVSGVGKSHLARDIDPHLYVVPPSLGVAWHDRYRGEETVLFDDFTGRNIPYADLLKYIDPWFQSVQVKGGYVVLCAKRVIFTSNFAPWEVYSAGVQSRHDWAFLRRLRDYGKLITFDNSGAAIESQCPRYPPDSPLGGVRVSLPDSTNTHHFADDNPCQQLLNPSLICTCSSTE